MKPSKVIPKIHEESLDRLDPILQHKVRLGACALLSNSPLLNFTTLKESLKATDGNLGAQLTKLEQQGYVQVTKEFQDRRPVTSYSLTPLGRGALAKHLQALQEIIDLTGTGMP